MQPSVSIFNGRRTIDTVADQLLNRVGIRALTVVDNYSRGSLAVLAAFLIRDDDVVALMKHPRTLYGMLERIPVDNGGEFIL